MSMDAKEFKALRKTMGYDGSDGAKRLADRLGCSVRSIYRWGEVGSPDNPPPISIENLMRIYGKRRRPSREDKE